jgi:hypothetical protein
MNAAHEAAASPASTRDIVQSGKRTRMVEDILTRTPAVSRLNPRLVSAAMSPG